MIISNGRHPGRQTPKDYDGGLSGVGVYRFTDGGDSWAVSLAGTFTCA